MTSPATDPRAARSREAILAAAYDLLAREGPRAIALMEQTRPGGAGARPHRHITAITERLAAAFALAVDAGELDTAPDAALAAAHLIGPLVYRTTLQAAAVPDSLLAGVIDSVADWQPPDPARSRPASAPGQPAGSNQETNAVAQA